MVKAGDGRESPPSSPRLRQSTFGATLDFIEALCDASSRLTSFPPVRVHPCPTLYDSKGCLIQWTSPETPLHHVCMRFPSVRSLHALMLRKFFLCPTLD